MNLLLIFSVLLNLGLFVSRCDFCSMPIGWRPPTTVGTILSASNVVYGRVIKIHPDDRIRSAYTVEMEVYCILKGPRTEQIINITEGGYVPALCHSSNFSVNREYIVIARERHPDERPGGEGLKVTDKEIDATDNNLNEVAKACGLNDVTRPSGTEKSSSDKRCPVSVANCQKQTEKNPTEKGSYGTDEDYDDDDLPKPESKTNKGSAVAHQTRATVAVVTLLLSSLVTIC